MVLVIGGLSYTLGSCPAKAPCSCVYGLINCEARRLQTIPHLTRVSDNFHTLAIGTNDIEIIHNDSFVNLNVTNLFLEYNKIWFIESRAFHGLKDLKVLRLQHNRLQVLPEALSIPFTLEMLDVSYNPIDGLQTINGTVVDGFSDNLMRFIGKSLTSFYFGSPVLLVHWPGSLSHLQQLKSLTVSGSVIQYLPALPFRAFEHTLETLSIEKTQLLQLPIEIGRFTQIKELSIKHNTIQNGDDIIVETVFADIGDTLEVLSLEYDNLTKFPEAIKYLVNLRNLSLAGNRLLYVTEGAIHSIGNGKLDFLSLSDCGLKRVPGALSNLTTLIDLDLSMNNIRTLESQDLDTLPNLVSVSFRGNPLKYISLSSFRGLNSLQKLDFSFTQLTVIPTAIQNLTSLREIDFTEVSVDCTCDLVWIKRWMELPNVNVVFRGRCETIDSMLQTYIIKRIPLCLQYSLGV